MINNETRSKNPFLSNLSDDSFIRVKRDYKSSLFAFMLTYDKRNALSLYNCINGSNYTNVDDLEFKTLENDVIFVKMRNDVSFLFDKSLNLYEHQSTYNPNMPLRGFLYFADLYRSIIDMSKIYKSTLIKIPTPSYIVFYNGEEKAHLDDKVILKLSDAFDCDDKPEGFEWTATMYNINTGHNSELMGTCQVLSDYSFFVTTVRNYRCDYTLKDAILIAIAKCLENGIMTDILNKYKWEVATMSWTEFSEKEYEKAITEDAIERGLRQGIEQGLKQGIEQGIEQGLQQGILQNTIKFYLSAKITKHDAMEELNMSESDFDEALTKYQTNC